ncbi:MAG: ATP-binding cassette domain-containing protein, partial [Candidatus Aegiribacteria sp.]|nr:ATP-binding cassette domain-containing protein [Candidatus Aegiribacteria sp.]
MNEAIRLDGVTAGYRRGNPIIHDIDLTVPKSDFLAIIGPNGGGKTTLLKVILGLLTPWEGSAVVLGGAPAKTHPEIGYVPQIIPDESFPITVMDVVLMGRLRNSGLFTRFARRDREI